jgi:hypothetical protein
VNYKKIIILIFAALSANTQARNITYTENVYMQQASPELVGLVAEVADDLDFMGNYELVEPKKAGLAVNAWNRFMWPAVNPLTKNNLIVINSEWFKDIPKDQQKYLIGACFAKINMGSHSTAMKIAPFLYSLISLLLTLLFYWGLSKTILVKYRKWIKFLIAVFIVILCELSFMDPIYEKYTNYLSIKYSVKRYESVIQKMDNKESAIKALKYLDLSIKKGLADGEEIYRAHENTYANLAKELRGSGQYDCCGH